MRFNNKRLRLCLVVLLILIFFSVGNLFGIEPSVTEPNMSDGYPLVKTEIPLWGDDQADLY